MLYGDSGAGKSSLINAGLIAAAMHKGFQVEYVRVQPRAGDELVVERIPADEADTALPSLFADGDEPDSRVVVSTAAFHERLRERSASCRPLLVFDQFEELVTHFEDVGRRELQRRIVALLVALLHDESLPVKVLFAFREDYLAKVKQLLAAAPELVDQALRLTPPAAGALATIIRGPFERYPGRFERELAPELVERLRDRLEDRFGAGEVSLSEVQTVCERLWQSDDPEALLEERGIQGLLEDHLGEELDSFPPHLRYPATALLGQMVTAAGTRNVISAGDLIERVREENKDLSPDLLEDALEQLERRSRLVRREARRDLYLYEITSEFLVPWISRRREELDRQRYRRRLLRRLLRLGTVVGVVIAAVAALAVWALIQRNDADRARRSATSLALAAASANELSSHLDVSLLLSLAALQVHDSAQARSSMISGLEAAHGSSVVAILRGHTDSVWKVALSPRGHTLASAGDDGVRLWDTRAHRPLGGPLPRGRLSQAVAFSPDGRTLAYGDFDAAVRLWDVRAHKQIGPPLRGHINGVTGLAFSPDGRTLASAGDDDTVRLWDVRSHKQLGRRLNTVEPVAFSPDGQMLATGGGNVRLWNVRTHRRVGGLGQENGATTAVEESVADVPGYPRSIDFSSDGRTLAAAYDDGLVRLWNVRTRQQVGRPLRGHTREVTGVAFSPDGQTLASASIDGTLRIWDVRTHEQLGPPLRGHEGFVWDVAFGPDGRTVASAGADDHTVRLWQVRTPTQLGRPLRAHRFEVVAVGFSPDGQTLASAAGGTVRFWSVRTGEPLDPPVLERADYVTSIAFSPDGRTLVTGNRGGTLRLWDVRTRQQLGRPLHGYSGHVLAVAFSPDGRILASAGPNRIVQLWDVRTREQLGRLRGNAAFSTLAFGADGRTVAAAAGGTAADDTTVSLWDVHTGRQILAHLGRGTGAVIGAAYVSEVALSPDGQMLASAASDGTVRLWDVRTHQQQGQPMRERISDATGLAFSPDGQMLAAGGGGGAIRLWDVHAHQELGRPLRGHRGRVSAIAFSPDGQTVATGGADKTVRLWQGIFWRDLADLRDRVCNLVVGNLTQAEWETFAPGLAYRTTCPY